jgi:hypothetical protein
MEFERALAAFKRNFPEGVRALVLEGGVACEGVLRFGEVQE